MPAFVVILLGVVLVVSLGETLGLSYGVQLLLAFGFGLAVTGLERLFTARSQGPAGDAGGSSSAP